MQTIPLKISQRNAWDRKVISLARQGMSYKAIASNTGLTLCQVRERIRRFGCGVLLYRTGLTSESFKVLSSANRHFGTAADLARRIGDLNHTRKVARQYGRELSRSQKLLEKIR